jgi:hypothetical protein
MTDESYLKILELFNCIDLKKLKSLCTRGSRFIVIAEFKVDCIINIYIVAKLSILCGTVAACRCWQAAVIGRKLDTLFL